jgi:hypothetical protein
LVSALPATLAELGFAGGTIEPFPLALTDPDDAFDLPTWPRFWRDAGGFTDDEIAQWDQGVARGRSGGFV